MQRNGESVFLTDLQPWAKGGVVDLNAGQDVYASPS
jgi:hypothetical protein